MFYVFAYVFVYELIIYKYKSDRWKRHNYEVRSIHLVLMKIHSLFNPCFSIKRYTCCHMLQFNPVRWTVEALSSSPLYESSNDWPLSKSPPPLDSPPLEDPPRLLNSLLNKTSSWTWWNTETVNHKLMNKTCTNITQKVNLGKIIV